jgi:hypothetical protein
MPVVIGLAWLPPGEAKQVGIGSLTSRILCQKHNNELSGLDDILGGMQRFAEAVNRHFGSKSRTQSAIWHKVDGHLLERALLKVAFGLTYSRSFTSMKGRPRPLEISADRRPHLLNVLFGLDELDASGGLFLRSGGGFPATDASHGTRCIVNAANEVIGLEIIFRKIWLAMAMDGCLKETEFAQRRPTDVQWTNEGSSAWGMLLVSWH